MRTVPRSRCQELLEYGNALSNSSLNWLTGDEGGLRENMGNIFFNLKSWADKKMKKEETKLAYQCRKKDRHKTHYQIESILCI